MNLEKIDLINLIPSYVTVGKMQRQNPLKIIDRDNYLLLRYQIEKDIHRKNSSKREYSELVPRFISRNKEAFEVIGLLQAEMGKTQNGCITFCNHEYQIIKKVMLWFNNQLEVSFKDWKWYIKLNMIEPKSSKEKEDIIRKLTGFWRENTPIVKEKAYPIGVSFCPFSKKEKMKCYDKGTLIIDFKNNLHSQIVKNLVKAITYSMSEYSFEEIKYFMRGIIAGESCVEINNKYKKFFIHLTAKEENERWLYQGYLQRLGINVIHYKGYKDIIISGKDNLLKLLKLKLMCSSPKKYNKFLRIKTFYKGFQGLDLWKEETKKNVVHNKIPQSKIKHIICLHHQHPDWPAWKIAKEVGVSDIKVQRVRRQYTLVKPIIKTTPKQFHAIINLHKEEPELRQKELADALGLHESRITRAIPKWRKQE